MTDAILIRGNNGGSISPYSNENNIKQAEEIIARNDLPAGRQLLQRVKDPLALVEQLLVAHIKAEKIKAEETAALVQTQSKAIAEINRLWGLVMKENIPNTDPNNNSKQTTLGKSDDAKKYLQEIDRIIKQDLGESNGIMKITGKDLTGSLALSVSYTDLQTMNATMTAYCDTIQVDLDSLNQEFKNNMTQITSAQEEVRNVRTAVVSMAQG